MNFILSKHQLPIVASVAALIYLVLFGLPDWPSQSETELIYQLDWNRDEIILDTDGTGWTATNDLGYTVHLRDGYLTNAGIELLPCEAPQTMSQLSPVGWLGPGTAYAGHGTGESDQSRLALGYVESLTDLSSVEMGQVIVPATQYCQAHYLVAAAPDSAQNLPTGAAPGLTLSLTGEFIAPNQTEAVPFAIQQTIAWGTIQDLQPIGSNRETLVSTSTQPPAEVLRVTVRRQAASLFDGVDFKTMSETDQARAILRSLTENTAFMIYTDWGRS